MPWVKPETYKQREDLGPYLVSIGPRMNTSEMDMVIYWQWVHAGGHRGPEEAWEGIRMTRLHAQDAIDKRIMPDEIYPLGLARATTPV
jgi:hypothetical protein